MSQDDQDAIMGRLFRETKETSERLALLRAKARELGEALEHIAVALVHCPHVLIAKGENYPPELVIPEGPVALEPEPMNFTNILKLTKDIRACMSKLNDLDGQRAALRM
jgi:hypothetical protein